MRNSRRIRAMPRRFNVIYYRFRNRGYYFDTIYIVTRVFSSVTKM